MALIPSASQGKYLMRSQLAVPMSTPASNDSSQPVPKNSQDAVTQAIAEMNETEALDRAVRLSLEDLRRQQPTQATQPRPSPRSLLKTSTNLVLSMNNEFAPLNDPHGDTAVYIGAPPQMPEQSDSEYDGIINHFDRIHIVQSSNLRSMGAKSRFTDAGLLSPTALFRAERKLRKLGVLQKAEAIRGRKFKYYIDLRPPKEDEEAVVLITQLTCTKGVLTWHLAGEKYRLDPEVAMGHDEFGVYSPPEILPSPVPTVDARDEAARPNQLDQPSDNECLDKQGEPVPVTAPEYSPLRHWSAVERLLYAIQGTNPKLDSAPKVWTFFAIARYFGCATHYNVSSHIINWMYKDSNVNFIQCNPEVAYRIGMGIQSAELLRDAFAFLVGERALLEVFSESEPKILSPLSKTVHGRKLELLDDDDRNRIDHAASSLVRRIRAVFDDICKNMDWLRRSKDYFNLDQIVGQCEEEVELLESTKILIKEYVRSRILYVLCQNQFECEELERNTASTLAFRSATHAGYSSTYNLLDHHNRLLTKTFWFALQRTQFDCGSMNISADGTVGSHSDTAHSKSLRGLFYDSPFGGITKIRRATFDARVSEVNRMLTARDVTTQHPFVFGSRHDHDNGHSALFSLRSQGPESPQSEGFTPEPIFQSPKRRKTIEADDSNLSIPTATLQSTSAPVDIPRSSRDTRGFATESELGSSLLSRHALLPLRPKPALPGPMDHGMDFTQRKHDQAKPEDQYNGHGPVTGTLSNARRPLLEGESLGASGDFALEDGARDKPANPSTLPSNSSNQWTKDRVMDTPDNLLLPEKAGGELSLESPSQPTRSIPKMSSTPMPNQGPSGLHQPIYHSHINPGMMLRDFGRQISIICSPIVYPSHIFHEHGVLPTNLFDTLQCVDANEFKYLPIWFPEGNDDDTGGVFAAPVPNSQDEAFSAGPIRRGYNDSDSDTDGSSVEDLASQAISTVGRASKLATDGTQTVQSLSTTSSSSSFADADQDLVMVDDSRSCIPASFEGDDSISADDFDYEDDDTDTVDGNEGHDEISASLQAFLDSDVDCHGTATMANHGIHNTANNEDASTIIASESHDEDEFEWI